MFAQDPPLFGRSAGICRLLSRPLILLASFQQSPNLVYAAGVRKSASCSSVKGAHSWPVWPRLVMPHSGPRLEGRNRLSDATIARGHCSARPVARDTETAVTGCSAVLYRRLHHPRRPPIDKIRPGSPAWTIGFSFGD